jgi:hypothetical protein
LSDFGLLSHNLAIALDWFDRCQPNLEFQSVIEERPFRAEKAFTKHALEPKTTWEIKAMKIRGVLLAVSCSALFVATGFAQDECIKVKAVNGQLVVTSCSPKTLNVAFTTAEGTADTFVLFPGRSYNTSGSSSSPYRYFTCVSPSVPLDKNTGASPMYNAGAPYCPVGGIAGSAR